MDSKQLFRLFYSKYDLASWLNEAGELAQSEGDVKWLYCGIGSDFKNEIVSQAIDNTFVDDEVYLCISSGRSLLVSKSSVAKEIASYLHKKEVGIISKALTKVMFFNTYGTFKCGVISDFPPSRPKPLGAALKVEFHANIVDSSTERVAGIIRKHFGAIEMELCKDYGGDMEHLWIDLELVSRADSWSFRFQKRVRIPSSYTEPYSYNVGHYSVKPNFEKLKELVTEESICLYVFELLYESTQILADNQKKIRGFNAAAFRMDFLAACKKSVYALKP